jgi:2-polyprenyl-3-methyl-5-hydroxy-6-metoxy-1,4-benzoquinol methylase
MNDITSERQQRINSLGYDYMAQPKTEVMACNLCHAERFVTLTHRDRYGFAARANACLQCGLVFLNPMMTVEAYREFYASIYRRLVSAYHGRPIDATTIQDEQKVYALELVEFIAPYINTNGGTSLLDIGGSTGVVANYLANHFGLAATVLDPAPLEVEQAKRLGLETIFSLLEDFEPTNRVFDVIIMCQTLDHLLDIGGALEKVRRLLSPSGIFFVDIVDFRAAYLRNWSVEEAIKIDHPYYLTEPTMEAYLTRDGLQMLRKNYAADHLHIGYVCRLGTPQATYLPPSDSLNLTLRETRLVQNIL